MENIAKKRQSKASQAQIDHMVDYFVLNPHVATGKFRTMNAHQRLRGSWDELASQLNGMFTKEGCSKDVKSWKSSWRDNKSAVAAKVAKIKKLKRATGNVKMPDNLQLTERDKKIIDLVGMEYMEGDPGVPDSFPEVDQSSIMRVDEEIVDEVEGVQFVEEQVEFDSEVIMFPNMPSPKQESHSAVTPEQPSIHRKRKQERTGIQLQEARIEFQAIAERQTACMESFAETMKVMTDMREDFHSLAERQIACMEMFTATLSQSWQHSFAQQEQINSLLMGILEKLTEK